MALTSATRLYVIVAREARTAVVFRRGPSKQVLLLRWNLETDALEEGQWLKGRIYERRCDLSPSGELLVYFAAKHSGKIPCWTAVSRPPWLTALAMWPKRDAWGGGGLFETERRLLLNRAPQEYEEHEKFRQGRKALKVAPFAGVGRGEDAPVEDTRLRRDGWQRDSTEPTVSYDWNGPVRVRYSQPLVYRRANPKDARRILEQRLVGWGQRDGPSHLLDFGLSVGCKTTELGRLDWADWDPNGDLLSARDGQLFRNEVRVADLRGMKFSERKAPVAVTRW